MLRPLVFCRRMLAAGAAAVMLAACTGSSPFLRQGDANSVEVGYAGDVASALPIARRHCAQFERVPLFVDATSDIAVFDCVRH